MSQTKAQLISDLVQALNFTGTSSAPANGLYLSSADVLKFATASVERLKLDGSGTVFNESGANVDFRIEGDTASHLFFIDASADNVGINTSSPGTTLDVAGDIRVKSSGVYKASHAGSASAPLYTTNDADTGMFSGGSNQLAFATGTDEGFRLNGNQRFLIGTSSSRTVGGTSGRLAQIEGTSVNGLAITRNTNNASPVFLSLGKTRGASVGGNTIVQSGDELGEIQFCGADGNDIVSRAAFISAFVDGTPGADDMPGRLVFGTTADGNQAPTAKMTIKSDGKIGIGTTQPTEPIHLESGSSGGTDVLLKNTGANVIQLTANANKTGSNSGILRLKAKWDGTDVAKIDFLCGGDTTNKDDGYLSFHVRESGSALAEAMRINSSSRVLIGTTAERATAGINSALQIQGTNVNTASLSITRNSNDNQGSFIVLGKTRGTSNGSNASVNDDDVVGAIRFATADGSNMQNYCAQIRADIDGTPGTDDVPGRLVFAVTADGNSVTQERMRITSSGNVGIGTTNPEQTLHVHGDALIEDTVGNHLTVRSTVGNGNDPNFRFEKARGGGTPAIVQNGDDVGDLVWRGYDGDNYETGASILGEVEGTPGDGDMPMRLTFKTRSAGAAQEQGRIQISADGTVSLLNNSNLQIPDKIIHSGDTDTAIRFPGANICTIETAGTERFRVASGGQILTGRSGTVPAATATLSLIGSYGGAANTAFLYMCRNEAATAIGAGESLGQVMFSSNDGKVGARFVGEADGSWSDTSCPGRLEFQLTPINSTTSVERMRIDSVGRVLIGISSAIDTGSNDGRDTLQAVHTAGAQLLLGRNDSAVTASNRLGEIRALSNDGGSYQTGGRIRFEADANHGADDKPTRILFGVCADGSATLTNPLVIKSNRRVGIGGEEAPDGLLHIGDGTNVDGTDVDICIGGNTGNTRRARIRKKIQSGDRALEIYAATGASDEDIRFFRDQSGEVMRLSSNGNVVIGSTVAPGDKLRVVGDISASGSITPDSDLAYKKDIQPLTNVLSKVTQLLGVNFTYKKNNEKSMGLIAQDVEKVFPELVRGKEGEKRLNYMGLTGALIEAIKELEAKVAALEAA